MEHAIELDICGSTNDELSRRLRADAALPTFFTVRAEQQTAGRGRADHAWVSPAGVGLYLSVLLRPVVPIERLPLCTIVVGLAVAEAVEAVTGLKAGLKWPNDVLVRGRKCCGILCEAAFGADGASAVVAGIGVNVNTDPADLPARPIFPATSLAVETGREVDRDRLAREILAAVRCAMVRFEAPDGAAETVARYGRRDALRGREITIDGVRAGRCEGLSDAGALLVRRADGTLEARVAGSVGFAEE